MPYKFTFDEKVCIQCGMCGDVCPVNTLDFTRPRHKNIEDTRYSTDAKVEDMTEYPIQVNKCIGCLICQEECPVSCITILEAQKEPKYAALQGPMLTEEPTKDTFSLSKHTKLRPTRLKTKDPWGHEYVYIPKRRRSQSETLDEPDMK